MECVVDVCEGEVDPDGAFGAVESRGENRRCDVRARDKVRRPDRIGDATFPRHEQVVNADCFGDDLFVRFATLRRGLGLEGGFREAQRPEAILRLDDLDGKHLESVGFAIRERVVGEVLLRAGWEGSAPRESVIYEGVASFFHECLAKFGGKIRRASVFNQGQSAVFVSPVRQGARDVVQNE